MEWVLTLCVRGADETRGEILEGILSAKLQLLPSLKGQNYRPGCTHSRNQHILSKVAETGQWQYQAMASYSHWSGQLQHCLFHPCLYLDCSQALKHAKTYPVALLWSNMWSNQGAVFPISTKFGFHSANIVTSSAIFQMQYSKHSSI